MTTGPGCARAAVEPSAVEAVSDLLWFLGATAVGERPVVDGVELEAGFATAGDAADAVAALAERGVTAEVVDVGPALDAALDAWMAHARPVRAGRLHVRPAWLDDDDDPPRGHEVVVCLDPSRAFGSGSHPSTLACLDAVDRFAGPGVSVLDVGCGSGVLAVAAARLGAGPVVAVDVDPVAVAATKANAAANGVADDVDARDGSARDIPGRFALVLANVGASVAIDLAPELATRVAPGGRLVVAGLYADRAEAVATALGGHGLPEVERRVDDGWACLIHQSGARIQHTVRRRHAGARTNEPDRRTGLTKEHDEPT